MAKEIYTEAYGRLAELVAPYQSVVDVEPEHLPLSSAVQNWSGKEFLDASEHEPSNPAYNKNFRQVLHLAFKIAAEIGPDFQAAVKATRAGERVTTNLYGPYIIPLFRSL
jgi:hypothetical protein